MAGKAEIPFRSYWSTPFGRRQGALATIAADQLAVGLINDGLNRIGVPAGSVDHVIIGHTIPWQARVTSGLFLQNELVDGPVVSHGCHTGLQTILSATREIELGGAHAVVCIAGDRTSNVPHVYFPDPALANGMGEDMGFTFESVMTPPRGVPGVTEQAQTMARLHGISVEQQTEIANRRAEQYAEAWTGSTPFAHRYMPLPFSLPGGDALDRDEPPLTPPAAVSPADGAAAMLVASAETVRNLGLASGPRIIVESAAIRPMAAGAVAAAQSALDAADVDIDAVSAVKTHAYSPVADLAFAQETGVDPMTMNNYGCSLTWGHAPAATALRSIIELIEELVTIGGGFGLFVGTAANGSAMAAVLRVDDR